MRLSYWEYESHFKNIHVAIIGAGITGLTAAAVLARNRPEWNIVVFEKSLVGAAASSRNAGFACFGSVSEIMADIQVYGEKTVVELVQKRRKGLELLLERHPPKRLRYSQVGGYELFLDRQDFELNESHISYVNQLLEEEIFHTCETPSGMNVHEQMIGNSLEGHLDTGHLYKSLESQALESGVRIVRGYEVIDLIEDDSHINIHIQRGEKEIPALQVLITTNALTRHLLPEEDVVSSRNQVLITEPIKGHGIEGTFHMNRGYLYFRDVGDRILIGGGRDKFPEEQIDSLGVNQSNQDYLLSILQQNVLPNRRQEISVSMAWSGLLAGGPKRTPIVERRGERATIAVRLGGMGVAIGTAIGQEAATLVMNDTF